MSIKNIIFYILLPFVCSQLLIAQDSGESSIGMETNSKVKTKANKISYWLISGTGIGNPGPAPVFSLGLSVSKKGHLLSLKSSRHKESYLFKNTTEFKDPLEQFQEYGIQYGYVFQKNELPFLMSVSAGPSFFNIKKRGDERFSSYNPFTGNSYHIYELVESNNWGGAINAFFAWVPSKNLGLGIDLGLKLNKEMLAYGIYFSFMVGSF